MNNREKFEKIITGITDAINPAAATYPAEATVSEASFSVDEIGFISGRSIVAEVTYKLFLVLKSF